MEREREKEPYVLCISSLLSFPWLMFVQMPTEYLRWKSTRLEISLLKTEILCVMSRHNPVVYIQGIFLLI